MGTVYYAVGKTNRQAIELGKGYGLSDFGERLPRRNNYDSFIAILIEHFRSEFYSKELSDRAHIRKLARKLLKVDTSFELVPDSYDGPDYVGVTVVDSFYENSEVLGKPLRHYLQISASHEKQPDRNYTTFDTLELLTGAWESVPVTCIEKGDRVRIKNPEGNVIYEGTTTRSFDYWHALGLPK